MGSESTIPSTVSDAKPQNPESELVKPMEGNGQDPNGETLKETSSKSVFVNSEPIREEQVQNAVKFLSHPKVSGSPVIYRRSFLEKKGLTKEEIDEAFRRVPDTPPTVTSAQPTMKNQDGQLNSSANMHTQTQSPQPAAAAPTAVVSTVATLSKYQFHWSHAFLAVGLLAASGAGSALFVKHAVVPRLKSWIRKVVSEEEEEEGDKKSNSKPSLNEEAAAAAKAAAAAAADVAKVSQEMLNSKSEEKKYFEAFRSLLDVQVEEMRSMCNAIRKLEATRDIALSSNKQTDEHTQTLSWNVRPPSAPASMEPSVTPHPKSYMEMTARVHRGEKPPGIREINDLPPNPNQLLSNPPLAPRVKPWEVVSQAQNNSSYGLQSHTNDEGSNSKEQDSWPTSQLNGYGSEPWWQQKNMRITEIESENEPQTTSNGAFGVTNQQVPQRVWVPPRAPPVAMPEAAAAIRQPKPLIPRGQTSNDQISAGPSDDIDDELQRVTKVSESGGQLEINNESPSLESNEIREQEISNERN
ncbi:peroxisomal membrane protein PEX14-like isoform X2 [Telopea speciosissima]|uniref:peroxisomal membrane protein PEX14-like isoform X2 n=1 Tax=Telopea speciosissima TaxID=54955 RepID=UPI001CC73DB0|nr:peroxisomal membrane protein PEX14-like isoform X2 [Telopea speciosissima]